jgi:hypothetical protein
METLCDALAAAYWDAMHPDEATEDDVAAMEEVLAALRNALQPWRREIIAAYRAHRADFGRRIGCREERLLGTVLPAIPRPPRAGEDNG